MLPRNKISKRSKRQRRSHDALKSTVLQACPNCGSAKKAHAACRECGYVRPGLQLKVANA